MLLLIKVLSIVAPVFLVAGTGFLWFKSGRDYPIEFISRFVTQISLPALTFTILAGAELKPSAVTTILLAALLAYLVNWAVFHKICGYFALERRTHLAPMIFGNTGNMGLPLCFYAFGQLGLELAIVVFAVTSILAFTLGIALISGRANVLRIFRDPVLWATGFGFLCLYNDVDVPLWLMNFLDLLGQLAIPLVLLTLGVSIAQLPIRQLASIFPISALKIGVSFLVAFGISALIGLDTLARNILILQMSTPVGVSSYILALGYDVDADRVARLVLGSTLISIISFPLLLAFMI